MKPRRRFDSLMKGMCGAALLAGSAGQMWGIAYVKTFYGPLHPEQNQPVSFTIIAQDYSNEIRKVDLLVYEYDWPTPATASIRPGGKWGVVNTWTRPPGTLNFQDGFVITSGFADATFVAYIVDIYDKNGNVTSTGPWGFAAGGWPFGSLAIPVWISPPVVGFPATVLAAYNNPAAGRINVVYTPQSGDPRYPNARAILNDVSNSVFFGFHRTPTVTARARAWGFHYSTEYSHIDPYGSGAQILATKTHIDTTNLQNNVSITFHSTNFQDWSSGHFTGSEPDLAHFGGLFHELGHAVFGLADEYATFPEPWTSATPYHNVYATQQACRDYLHFNVPNGPALYQNPAYCTAIPGTSRWKMDPLSENCVMRIGAAAGNSPRFGPICNLRANYIYSSMP